MIIKIEIIALILLIIGTFVCWIAIWHFNPQSKKKKLLTILSIPFGWIGLILLLSWVIEKILLLISKFKKNEQK